MKLIKILSDKIQIKSDRFEFQDIRINSLIAVSDGEVELVTMVTSLMETDTGDSIGEEDFIFENDGIKVIECSIIGSIRNGSPGEVLIIGDAVPIPLKIQVELAKERPQSRTIDFWDRWSANPTVDLKQGIEAYMDL